MLATTKGGAPAEIASIEWDNTAPRVIALVQFSSDRNLACVSAVGPGHATVVTRVNKSLTGGQSIVVRTTDFDVA